MKNRHDDYPKETESKTHQSPEDSSILLEPREVPHPEVKLTLVDVPEPEEVTRLAPTVDAGKERIKVEKAKLVKREDTPNSAEVQESQWGSSLGAGWGGLTIGGGVVILLLVALVFIRGYINSDSIEDDVITEVGPMKVPLEADDPEKWFYDRSGKINDEAVMILEKFMSSADIAEQSNYVSDPKKFLYRVARWNVPFDPDLRMFSQGRYSVGHVEDCGYYVFRSKNKDQTPFRAYFVRVENELKLDWSATVGYSNVSFAQLRIWGEERRARLMEREFAEDESHDEQVRNESLAPAEDLSRKLIEIRCKIMRSNSAAAGFYAGPYSEDMYSEYKLISPDGQHSMWGYVRKGSEIDKELSGLINFNHFILTLKKDKRVTLRVKIGKNDALPSQLELIELMAPEWVTPESK